MKEEGRKGGMEEWEENQKKKLASNVGDPAGVA